MRDGPQPPRPGLRDPVRRFHRRVCRRRVPGTTGQVAGGPRRGAGGVQGALLPAVPRAGQSLPARRADGSDRHAGDPQRRVLQVQSALCGQLGVRGARRQRLPRPVAGEGANELAGRHAQTGRRRQEAGNHLRPPALRVRQAVGRGVAADSAPLRLIETRPASSPSSAATSTSRTTRSETAFITSS